MEDSAQESEPAIEDAALPAQAPVYKQPELSFTSEPVSIASAPAGFASRSGNFFRSARWCPDGSCVLTHEEDRTAKIYAMPAEAADVASTSQALKPYLSLPPAPAALLGLAWYPFASAQRPETFCFIKSVRDVPVALVDGNTGKIRASYSIIDHQERFIGPQSMTFSLDGMKLYCGFESAIECFHVANPGNNGTRFLLSPNRKSRQGQKGMISSIALCPDGTGLMAAGSYSRSICLYDASGGQPKLIRSLKSKEHRGSGVTQAKFHPTSPEMLYTASRSSDSILVWDIRNTNSVLMTHHRKGNTNQRIAFDIDVWGKWLTTGDTDGNVHFFDTHDPEGSEPVQSYKVADDTVSSAALHPLLPYLMTASGSRRVSKKADGASESSGSSSDSSDSDSDEDEEADDNVIRPTLTLPPKIVPTSTSSMPIPPVGVSSSKLDIWKIS